MKGTRTPIPVRLSRIRREIDFLKAVLRNNQILLPRTLADLLATKLPEKMDARDRRRLQLCQRQERELRALRDRTCPLKVASAPRVKGKPVSPARFCSGGLPSLGRGSS